MQRIMKLAVLAAVSASIVAAAPTPTIAATAHRAVVKVVAIKTGLNGPSAFTFAPGGTIWYLERGTGEVHTLNPSTGGDHRVFTIPGVDGNGERGALGIALHPNWPATPRVFVYVTRTHAGHLQNQLVRFSVSEISHVQLRAVARPKPFGPLVTIARREWHRVSGRRSGRLMLTRAGRAALHRHRSLAVVISGLAIDRSGNMARANTGRTLAP